MTEQEIEALQRENVALRNRVARLFQAYRTALQVIKSHVDRGVEVPWNVDSFFKD